MAHGPQAGLDLVDALASDPALTTYPYLPSARGDFLERLGRLNEARGEFERAAGLTKNTTGASPLAGASSHLRGGNGEDA